MNISKSYSILIADDDSDEIELLTESVGSHSQFKINHFAKNGLELVDYIQQNPNTIDVIISDMFMPALSGIEAVEKLESEDLLGNTLVIIFSNTVNISNNVKFKATDRLKFYTKPSTISEYNNLPEKLLKLLREGEFASK